MIGNSGAQRNRIGRKLVPMPWPTYILDRRSVYQPPTYCRVRVFGSRAAHLRATDQPIAQLVRRTRTFATVSWKPRQYVTP